MKQKVIKPKKYQEQITISGGLVINENLHATFCICRYTI